LDDNNGSDKIFGGADPYNFPDQMNDVQIARDSIQEILLIIAIKYTYQHI
jgi:hypothetical protein